MGLCNFRRALCRQVLARVSNTVKSMSVALPCQAARTRSEAMQAGRQVGTQHGQASIVQRCYDAQRCTHAPGPSGRR